MEFAVATARRGWATAADVVNTRPLRAFLESVALGAWRSLVARTVRVGEVLSSNLSAHIRRAVVAYVATALKYRTANPVISVSKHSSTLSSFRSA